VYEAPAATLLYFAHKEIEYLTLDKDTFQYKEHLSLEYARLVYNGEWFTLKRESLDKIIDETQKYVNGKVVLKLYKGNIFVKSRFSPNSLYEYNLASFDKQSKGLLEYDQKDAGGFINIFSLQHRIFSIKNKK
jgi:argininosuccinate synthase